MTRARKNEQPAELDVRSSVREALTQTGQIRPRIQDLYEKVREPLVGSRFLFVVDSSGSHAARERMRAVKGAVVGLVERSLRRRDEVVVIVFRGETAELLVEPTSDVATVLSALEYMPTGGRTPLAHALELAHQFINDETLLLLLTDGRANVPSRTTDPVGRRTGGSSKNSVCGIGCRYRIDQQCIWQSERACRCDACEVHQSGNLRSWIRSSDPAQEQREVELCRKHSAGDS